MNELLRFLEYPDVQLALCFGLMILLLVVGLLILSDPLREKTMWAMLFKCMCINLILVVAVSFLRYVTLLSDGLFFRILYVIVDPINETTDLYFLIAWVLYADFLLYGSRDHILRRYPVYLIPAVIINIIRIAVQAVLSFVAEVDPAFKVSIVCNYVDIALGLIYLAVPAVRLVLYRRRTGRLVRLRIWAFMIPILVCFLLRYVSFWEVMPLGFAVGLINLYFSMVDVWKYESTDEGCFNREYLQQIREYAGNGEKEYGSAILVYSSGENEKLPGIIRSELPKGTELVNAGNGRFIAFMSGTDRSLTDYVVTMIQEDVDEYDEAHPDAPVNVTLSSKIRGKDESISGFINRVIDDIGR